MSIEYNKIDLEKFKAIKYSRNIILFFDPDGKFHQFLGHKRRTRLFPYHKNLIEFLEQNSEMNVYFTLDESIESYRKINGCFLVNMKEYIKFCDEIQSKTSGRAQAFFGKHIAMEKVLASEEIDKIILDNSNEQKIIDALNKMNPETQSRVLENLSIFTTDKNATDNDKNFAKAFEKIILNPKVQLSIIQSIPKIQIETLKDHKKFLEENLDKNETYIQNWLDENDAQFRKQRCLIFGLEFTDHKREGELSSKRFDLLTRQSEQNNEYVLFELKSPKEKVFETKEVINDNGGKSVEYILSSSVSRAIPQILHYKELFENASDDDLEKIGVKKGKICKCVVLIGQRQDDPLWKSHFMSIKSNFSSGLEIWTYTDLINKLAVTIKNLEENL